MVSKVFKSTVHNLLFFSQTQVSKSTFHIDYKWTVTFLTVTGIFTPRSWPFGNLMGFMYRSNRSLNIPRAYPGHLTSFPAREGGNLINLVFPWWAFDHYSLGVGNLIASLDFMLPVPLIPRGVINHGEDKPSCIQSERYPIRGGLAEKQRLAKAFFCI